MLERNAIERILRANGVTPTAPDEEITSILIEAKWHKDDVDMALTVLRENIETHEQKVDSLRNIFDSDNRLRPETISALLGIDVNITRRPESAITSYAGDVSPKNMVSVALVSFGLAAICIVGGMWFWEIGIFHYSF